MELLILVLVRLVGLALVGCMLSFYFTPLKYFYRLFNVERLCTFCTSFWVSMIYNFVYMESSLDVGVFTSLISAFVSTEIEKRLTKIKIEL